MDNFIEAIKEIANNKKVIDHLEPDLMWHSEIKNWQVKRVLYALGLFIQEAEKCETLNN